MWKWGLDWFKIDHRKLFKRGLYVMRLVDANQCTVVRDVDAYAKVQRRLVGPLQVIFTVNKCLESIHHIHRARKNHRVIDVEVQDQ